MDAKKLRKEADLEWSRVIREVGHCERCEPDGDHDEGKSLNAHHLIGRSAYAYRHDLSNGICLCASCHTMSAWSAHEDKTGFMSWLERNRPGQWAWYCQHTVAVEKQIGNEIVIVRHAKPGTHRGDAVELEELKGIRKG